MSIEWVEFRLMIDGEWALVHVPMAQIILIAKEVVLRQELERKMEGCGQ